MAREFDRNMLIMLVAIMAGVIIVTYFIADIQRQTQIDTITTEHITEIKDIQSVNENFTDNFLQGIVKIDAARETRELSNYYFDFALFWYNTALTNTTNETKRQCMDNCTDAMNQYIAAHESFGLSKPYFEKAKTFTEKDNYIEVLGYYISFSQVGQNITSLRYQASEYLKYAVENLTIGVDNTNSSLWNENTSMLMDLFNEAQSQHEDAEDEYDELKGQIDDYIFFDEIREEH